MRSAPAILEVAGKQIGTDILIPLSALSRMLVGFQAHRQLNVALLGNHACFAGATNRNQGAHPNTARMPSEVSIVTSRIPARCSNA